MISILLVDDHALLRQGLRDLIRSDSDLTVVGEAANGKEGLDLCLQHKPNVVLLDLALPDQNGLELLNEIKMRLPETHVLVLSMYSEDEFGIQALRFGASGYLTKDTDPSEILDAIIRVVKGQLIVSKKLFDLYIQRKDNSDSLLPHKRLSPREFQIFCSLAKGQSITEISKILKINIKTVSTHRNRILEKMDLKNNVEIGQYALKNKLL